MAELKNKRWIVLDVKKGQWGAEKREKIIKETAMADGKHVRIWIEQEPGSGGKESAENTLRNLAGFACYAERPTGEKEVRAEPFSVQVNPVLIHHHHLRSYLLWNANLVLKFYSLLL